MTYKMRTYMPYHTAFQDQVSRDYRKRLAGTFYGAVQKAKTDMQILEECDNVYRNVIDTITNLRTITLYQYQLDMARLSQSTTIKYVYKQIWAKRKADIMQRHGMTVIEDTFFVWAPRRTGKTMTLAVFCLAVATNVQRNDYRKFRIAVFATGETAALEFLEECNVRWGQINRNHKFEVSRKANSMEFTSLDDPTDIRKIRAYVSGEVCSFFLFGNK